MAAASSSASATGGDSGWEAQMDAVERAASQLHSRSSSSWDKTLGFDFGALELKVHHESRPLWVVPTGRVFLEAFSPLYEQARDFLVAICEPKSRPEFIHEYALDRHALFAAASMGLTGELICEALEKFSKTAVPAGVKAFVMACTSRYGKVKLVLHRSRFYIESPYPSLLRQLAEDPAIRDCRVLATASSLQHAKVDKDGFLIGEAKAEGVDSINLAGIADVGSGRAEGFGRSERGGPGALAMIPTETRGGARMSKRVTGEVDEDEEDEDEDDVGDAARAARAGRDGPGGQLSIPTTTSALNGLTDEELIALVDEEEARSERLRDPGPAAAAAAAASAGTATPAREAGEGVRRKPGVRPRKRPREPDGAHEAAPEPDSDRSGAPASRVLRFEIRADRVDVVRKACANTEPPVPLMLEYDFREDRVGVPTLAVELTNPEGLRPYQSRSLAKMFGNGRARSGMIVLPCGAGKTLVGIAAAATIKKSTIVLCPNETSINQWADAFARFATFARPVEAVIKRLTRSSKEPLPDSGEAVILLTTYSMIGMRNSAKAAAETVARMRQIESREWGLMVLDETHQVVAETFRRVLFLSAHCRLGLTATLVREDGKDRELVELIGPKLYEANWMDLTRGGFLANVQVVEVWCPMSPPFLEQYLSATSKDRRSALAVMNPVKAWAASHLLQLHMDRPDDKIIVFSDSRFALERYATAFRQPMIHGDTTMADREAILGAFRDDPAVKVIFLSKVGDVALDVPDANVIIQISSHYGSRMQEAQRMGRILRKKKTIKAASRNHAFFYTLLSTDTEEVAWSLRRRRYLVDQGYAYKVLTAYPGLATRTHLEDTAVFLKDSEQQQAVLTDILRANLKDIEGKEDRKAADVRGAATAGQGRTGFATSFRPTPASAVTTKRTTMEELSGGTGLRYIEYSADADRKKALSRLAATPATKPRQDETRGTGNRFADRTKARR